MFTNIRSDRDGKLLFRFAPEMLCIEIVARRYSVETGAYHPKELIDLTAHLPEPVRTRVMMALAGTVDLYAYYPPSIADRMHACNGTAAL